ncbi:hypothetical protein D3C80_1584110 [compost metagenome]
MQHLVGLHHVIALGHHGQGVQGIGAIQDLAASKRAQLRGIGGDVKHHLALFNGPVHAGGLKPDIEGLLRG